MANSCVGKGPGCVPCAERFVSCAGRPDGNSSYPGQVRDILVPIIKQPCVKRPPVKIVTPLNTLVLGHKSISGQVFITLLTFIMKFWQTNQISLYSYILCHFTQSWKLWAVINLRVLINIVFRVWFFSFRLTCYTWRHVFQEMTRRFVTCQSGRTVSDEYCTRGYFDPVRRTCANRLDSGTLRSTTNNNKITVEISNTCILTACLREMLIWAPVSKKKTTHVSNAKHLLL